MSTRPHKALNIRTDRVNAVSTDFNNTSTSCSQAHLVGEQAGEAVDGEPRAHGLLLRMHHVRLAIHLQTWQMLLISFVPRFLSNAVMGISHFGMHSAMCDPSAAAHVERQWHWELLITIKMCPLPWQQDSSRSDLECCLLLDGNVCSASHW